jgi:outer membrane protein OmpA-like peptidoglycan-associated protein
MNVLGVVSVAFLFAVPACRTDVPAQRPAAPDVASAGAGDVDAAVDDEDVDRDGIPNWKDACPNDAEDHDGFDDTDGCPERDNDLDRILDENDKCPNEPETYNGIEDDDGCPDYGDFTRPIPHTQLPADPILFGESSAKIRPDTAVTLDAYAAFINDGARAVTEVTIAGHAATYEKRPPALAAARAEAVRRYLVRRGVRAKLIRVTPFGAGTLPCDQPDSGCDPRRVDFQIGIGL